MTICLVTTGQPSTNPRLVKEADALVEAGFHVRVVGAYWADWATAADNELLTTKRWSLTFVDWRRGRAPRLFRRSRVRHWAARRLSRWMPSNDTARTAALSRVGPELGRAAASIHADLYIAHNLGALPGAIAAARAHRSRVAFDAEDFHSGQLSRREEAASGRVVRTAEQRLLPQCAYVTAASPGIAEAYRDLCGIPLPTTVLNVFPLADRPDHLRRTTAGDPVRLYWFSQTIGRDRGLELAVRAMGLLKDHAIELHLRGAWQPGYEAALRTLASSCGVSASRIVGHPPASSSEMVRLAADYDVGLALEPGTSVNNDLAISNKIFTYLLAGTPSIVTRTRGQSRLLPDLGAAAAGCVPDDPESFAAALLPWLRDPAGLNCARQAAWHIGETRYNWDREQSLVLALVQRVVGRA